MDIHCQRDKNRTTLFSSKYNIPKTIVFDVTQSHLSISSLRCWASQSSTIYHVYIYRYTLCMYRYYSYLCTFCIARIVHTCTLFMYHRRRERNFILLDVQLAFTVSPTSYSSCKPEIHGPSPSVC